MSFAGNKEKNFWQQKKKNISYKAFKQNGMFKHKNQQWIPSQAMCCSEGGLQLKKKVLNYFPTQFVNK